MLHELLVCQLWTRPLLSKRLVPARLTPYQPFPPRFCSRTAESTMLLPPELLTPFEVQLPGQAPPAAVFVMFIWRNVTLLALVNDTAWLVVRLIVPPEPLGTKRPEV